MKTYRLRTSDIQATPIDASWLAFLTKEKGFTGMYLGDYFYVDVAGIDRVMSKACFERLFAEV